MQSGDHIDRAVDAIRDWQRQWGAFSPHRASAVDGERLAEAWNEYLTRLGDSFPAFHPRYTAHMLRAPHPVAAAGYLAAMLINPNNHGLEGGPATSEMEKAVVRDLAAMFHLPPEALGHLTSGGTVANLEALFVARELHPDRAVAIGADAHYAHARICHLLRVPCVTIPVDGQGRMDLDALEAHLRREAIGTVVLTAGTTGLGAVDPIESALELRERYGCRLHVDAAYGGFYAINAWAGDPHLPAADLRALGRCDSIVVDPHKHGLQPYGCGAVLFANPTVARFYIHDSPATYFTSDDLHLGQISFECSRPGAAAGALWLTTQIFPLTPDGLGAMLAAGLRATAAWTTRIEASDALALYQRPQTGVLTYFPSRVHTVSELDEAAGALLHRAMEGTDPAFISVLRVRARDIRRRAPHLAADAPEARINRSVLMKPEHEDYVQTLHALVEMAAR